MNSVSKRRKKKNVLGDAVQILVQGMKEYWKYVGGKLLKESDSHNRVVRRPLEFKEYTEGQEFFLVKRPQTTFTDKDAKQEYKISAKLLERFVGPYRVIRRISPVQYDADVDGEERRVHAINMKPA
jgi:hypothetical protein